MYKVIIKPLAEREFRKLSKELQKKFYEGFRKLSIDPFALPNLKRIKGTKFGWRFRVGRWRILFSLFDKEKRIEIVDIFFEKRERRL